jgi:arylsulfatase A-like enzyme
LFTEDIPYPSTFNDDWATRDTLRLTVAGSSKFAPTSGDLRSILSTSDAGKNNPFKDDLAPAAFRKGSYQVFMKGYLRLIASLDENIVRLLDYLDKAGLTENTLVVYTTDNGFFLGDHGLFNKMWMYEESLRIPLIVRYPGKVAKGTVCSHITSALDFAPTFTALAKAEQPKEFQGKSLLPLFENAKTSSWTRKVHYYHYYDQWEVPSHCGVRTATHKLICFYDNESGPVWELFDLIADPKELNNIAGQPQSQELLRSMKKLLIEEAQANEDPVIKKLL